MNRFEYPQVKSDDTVVEKTFGIDIADPYRYLEDPKDERTKQFVDDQNKVTFPYLEKCPYRQRFKEILTSNKDYKDFGCTFKRGGKYYFFMNSGLQPQSVLYQQDTIDGEPRVFFDPNELGKDGLTSLSVSAFSPNGQYFAYALASKGSDWMVIHVKDVSTGKDLSDIIQRAKCTPIRWTHDNKGFFYAQFPNHEGDAVGTDILKNHDHTIYYHVIGTQQYDDSLKVNFPEHPNYTFYFDISDDGKYFHVFPRDSCHGNSWYYCDLTKFAVQDKLTLKTIYDGMNNVLDYISSNGDTVYFSTNIDAPNYRVVKLDINNPSRENWIDVISNHPQDLLEWAEVFTVNGVDYILLNFCRKVTDYMELHKLEGELVKKFNTLVGTISKYSGRREDGEIFYQVASFLSPSRVYHFDLNNLNGEPRMLRETKPKNFNPDDYEVKQVFYKSKPDAEVPMFIVHKKDISLDGSNPCILYGYGGFNIQLKPFFSINRLVWLKNFRGIFAVANIRGGGEFGQKWHDSGRLLNKQNCFNDFIAAAEYLICNNYTSKNKIAIEGGSNGGLLVAAVSNQRPDLFGATLCHVGVLDMLRFHLFTVGETWVSDYGNPEEKEHFDNIIKYSPYHNIPDNVDRYPATLLMTADHDDRVIPGHSFKFIAKLQAKLGNRLPETPLLVRIEKDAGHSSGKPVYKQIEMYMDLYAFLYNVLELKDYFVDC